MKNWTMCTESVFVLRWMSVLESMLHIVFLVVLSAQILLFLVFYLFIYSRILVITQILPCYLCINHQFGWELMQNSNCIMRKPAWGTVSQRANQPWQLTQLQMLLLFPSPKIFVQFSRLKLQSYLVINISFFRLVLTLFSSSDLSKHLPNETHQIDRRSLLHGCSIQIKVLIFVWTDLPKQLTWLQKCSLKPWKKVIFVQNFAWKLKRSDLEKHFASSVA